MLVAQALLPNLRAGADKKAIFITSRMGSIDDNSSGRYYDYRSAKAGLNAAVASLAIDTKSDGLIALALHPGWVKTDIGGEKAPLEASDSVSSMRSVIAKLTAKDSGRFLEFTGKEIPW